MTRPQGSATEAPVHPTIAALRARLRLTDEEVRDLVRLAERPPPRTSPTTPAPFEDVFDGSEWDEDVFNEWLQEEILNHVIPPYRRIKRAQRDLGWTFVGGPE